MEATVHSEREIPEDLLPTGQRVLIFGYNRGIFLNNAVNSVLRHIPNARITVVDDHSDDSETTEILERLGESVEVLRPPRAELDETTGGLHNAMNFAFDQCEARGEDIVLVMQDDMQIVRTVGQQEIVRISSFFECSTSSFVLGCGFCKTYKGTRNAQMHRIGDFYFRDHGATRVASTYIDTGLFSIVRLRETLGKLTVGEASNQERSANAELRLGFTTMPFMCFLPFPVSYRSRRRNWRSVLFDFVSGAGVHEVQALSGERLAAFLQRDPDIIPFDEDWLTAPTLPSCEYWSHHGGRSNAKSRGGWRRRLAKIL